jgi:putative acetyltransferase
MTERGTEIRQVAGAVDIAVAKTLFAEYAASLGFDLEYQGFSAELAQLPGAYAPPRGRLLLATVGGRAAGCVALRPLGEAVCEVKRLYVRSDFRGGGVGRMLAVAIIDAARTIGYEEVKLDTLVTMTSARRLYEGLGFTETEPYSENFIAGTCFYALRLR